MRNGPPQNKLCQVIRANGKAIEAGSKVLDEDHIRGNLTHHVDLQAIVTVTLSNATSAMG